jgi:hypothetical protein
MIWLSGESTDGQVHLMFNGSRCMRPEPSGIGENTLDYGRTCYSVHI